MLRSLGDCAILACLCNFLMTDASAHLSSADAGESARVCPADKTLQSGIRKANAPSVLTTLKNMHS